VKTECYKVKTDIYFSSSIYLSSESVHYIYLKPECRSVLVHFIMCE